MFEGLSISTGDILTAIGFLGTMFWHYSQTSHQIKGLQKEVSDLAVTVKELVKQATETEKDVHAISEEMKLTQSGHDAVMETARAAGSEMGKHLHAEIGTLINGLSFLRNGGGNA